MDIDKKQIALRSDNALYCYKCDRLFIGEDRLQVHRYYREHKLNHEN